MENKDATIYTLTAHLKAILMVLEDKASKSDRLISIEQITRSALSVTQTGGK